MQVDITNLTKTFGTLRANDAITLSFAAAQIHGVLGENGAGKSTLMKLLSGFLQPDAGEVLLNNKPVRLGSPGAALQAGIGMVHQDPLDVPAFTVLENFYCGSHANVFRNRGEARRALVERAARLGFQVDPNATIASLTVGQRQQLEILRLLAGGARLLILDEPTTGISAAQARSLFAALKTLAADGATVLFVSHKLDEVAELCNTVSVLRAGKLQGEGQMPMPQPVEKLLGMMFGEQASGVRGQGSERYEDTETQRHGHRKAQSDGQPTTTNKPHTVPHRPPSTVHRPIWHLEHASATDGMIALQNVSLNIEAGVSIGLAGLEGSGQQVLLRLLAGSLRPTTGRVIVDGVNLSGAELARFREAGIEYLPADRLSDGVIGTFSLADHFALLRPAGEPLVDFRAAVEQAQAAIVDYSIKATPTTPIASLSGGNQQRAMLALVPPDSRGILLDQPTRGLDVASARGVWARLQQRQEFGATLVFASADLDELLDHSDHMLVFFAGRMSRLIPRADLDFARLAELIGGVGFGATTDDRQPMTEALQLAEG